MSNVLGAWQLQHSAHKVGHHALDMIRGLGLMFSHDEDRGKTVRRLPPMPVGHQSLLHDLAFQ